MHVRARVCTHAYMRACTCALTEIDPTNLLILLNDCRPKIKAVF